MEAVDRIHEAASGLAQRIAEIESAEQQLDQLEQRLVQWAQQLLQVPQAQALESAVVPEAV